MTTNTVWRHGLLLAAAALSGACGDDRDNGVKVDEAFCFGMEDTETWELEALDDDPSSGQIWGRLATDESDDIHKDKEDSFCYPGLGSPKKFHECFHDCGKVQLHHRDTYPTTPLRSTVSYKEAILI